MAVPATIEMRIMKGTDIIKMMLRLLSLILFVITGCYVHRTKEVSPDPAAQAMYDKVIAELDREINTLESRIKENNEYRKNTIIERPEHYNGQ